MEDDWAACDKGVFQEHFPNALLYATEKLGDNTFRGLRLASGLSGLLLR